MKQDQLVITHELRSHKKQEQYSAPLLKLLTNPSGSKHHFVVVIVVNSFASRILREVYANAGHIYFHPGTDITDCYFMGAQNACKHFIYACIFATFINANMLIWMCLLKEESRKV